MESEVSKPIKTEEKRIIPKLNRLKNFDSTKHCSLVFKLKISSRLYATVDESVFRLINLIMIAINNPVKSKFRAKLKAATVTGIPVRP